MHYWIEKMEGNKEGMTPAEPLGIFICQTLHSIPFVMSFGLFVAAFGAIVSMEIQVMGDSSNDYWFINYIWMQCSFVQLKMIMDSIFIKKI